MFWTSGRREWVEWKHLADIPCYFQQHVERRISIIEHLPWQNVHLIRWWCEWVLLHGAGQREGRCRILAHSAHVIWSDEVNRAIDSVEEANQFDRWPMSRCCSTVRCGAVDETVVHTLRTSWLDGRSLVRLVTVCSDHWDKWMHTEHPCKTGTTISQSMLDQRDHRTQCSSSSLLDDDACIAACYKCSLSTRSTRDILPFLFSLMRATCGGLDCL